MSGGKIRIFTGAALLALTALSYAAQGCPLEWLRQRLPAPDTTTRSTIFFSNGVISLGRASASSQ